MKRQGENGTMGRRVGARGSSSKNAKCQAAVECGKARQAGRHGQPSRQRNVEQSVTACRLYITALQVVLRTGDEEYSDGSYVYMRGMQRYKGSSAGEKRAVL